MIIKSCHGCLNIYFFYIMSHHAGHVLMISFLLFAVGAVDGARRQMFRGNAPRPNVRASPQQMLLAHLHGTIKGYARLCLTEARVPSFNGEKADLKPAITSFYMYFYVIPFFSPLKSGTRASLRHESVTTFILWFLSLVRLSWGYVTPQLYLLTSIICAFSFYFFSHKF